MLRSFWKEGVLGKVLLTSYSICFFILRSGVCYSNFS